MASYFNLTLDTLAPEGLTLAINDGALYTTSVTVKLTVGLTDEAISGYQMKIWGIDGVAEEAAASWETYAATKSVTLTEGDGLKTVFIKVRDDVGNETGAVSDTITLNTAVPVVTVTGPDKAGFPRQRALTSPSSTSPRMWRLQSTRSVWCRPTALPRMLAQ